MPESRKASTPTAGAARDAFRTLLGFGIAFLSVKLLGPETADTLAGPVEAGIVVLSSMIFAFVGKKMRNDEKPLGEVL